MFDNIGGKFKGLAKVYFWFLTVASLGTSLVTLMVDTDVFLLVGLPCLAGPIIAWLSALGLYAIGEVIDTLHTIAANTRRASIAGNDGIVKSQVQTQAEDERLKKLETLRAQGLISEEEFKQAATKQQ